MRRHWLLYSALALCGNDVQNSASDILPTGLVEAVSVSPSVVSVFSPAGERLTVSVQRMTVTEAKAWRKELAEFFGLTPKLQDNSIRTFESGHLEVDLQDVVPRWTLQWNGKKAPAETNCMNTAFYLAGALPDPFGAHKAMYWGVSHGPALVSEWEKRGEVQKVSPAISQSKVGDVLETENHFYIHLGNGLVFENNPLDRFQTYIYSRLDAQGRLVHGDEMPYPPAKQGYRVIKKPDFEKYEAAWAKTYPDEYVVYKKVRDEMRAAWFDSKSFAPLSDAELKTVKQVEDLAGDRWRRVKGAFGEAIPRSHYVEGQTEFDLFCTQSLSSYRKALRDSMR